MKRAIATNSGLSLFQTGFTTLYEGTPLEEVFPAGEIIDEEGNVFPVANIISLLTKQNWNIIAQTEDAITKGRPRQFASRSEAGRYAAQIRWGNRGNAGKPSGAGNGVPIPATNDINEAILTGAPYAPFIEENYPPEIKAICKRAEESYPSPVSLEDERLLNQYFLGHIDPKNYSEETKLAMANAEKSNFHYEGLTKEGAPFDVMRKEQAQLMASQQLRKSYSVGYMKGYEAESLAYTKDHVASPNKAVSVAVHLDDLALISTSGIIKNQFHGGFIQSSGMNHTGLRAAHEAIAYGIHPLALPDRRPIYGNLHPLGVQHMYANGTSQYGSVQLVMKPEVHARSTFSVSDSLGSVRNAQPINGPITAGQPSNSIKTTKGGPQERLKRITNGQPHEYAESQIHGGIKLSDISYIAYSASSKPSQQNTIPTRVRQFAKKNGLKIVVIPNDPYKPWGIVDINGPVKKAVDAIVAKIYEAVEKGRKRRFATRTEAAQYAANIRWANNRGGDTATEEEEMASISAELSQIQLQCATYDDSRMTGPVAVIQENNYDQSPVVGKTENLAVYVGNGNEPVPSRELATLSQRTHAIGERVTGVAERRLTAKGVTPESAKKEQDEIMARGQQKRKEEQQAHFELRKATVRHDAQQTPESLEAKKQARTKSRTLKAERETIEEEWSRASYEARLTAETRGVMGELVDMGNPTSLNRLKIVGLPTRFKQDMMADLPTVFPSSVIDKAITQQAPRGRYILTVAKSNSQMYLGAYTRDNNSISISPTAGTYLQVRSTGVHEFGHAVDFAHPISHALNMAFVARRIRTGHQDKVTDDITKGSFWSRPVKNPRDTPYGVDGRREQYEDEFYRTYTGRNYSGYLQPTSKSNTGGGYSRAFPATEVLTTGVEALFGMEKYNGRFDRDLVNHTVGVLLSISGGVIKKSVDAMDKAQSFGGNRSEAGRYAARIRWGNRLGNSTQPTDGDPLFDATTQLTPEQEAIAAQAEGAVVDPFFAGGNTSTEQQVNALLAAGFVGKGEPPKPPKTKYSEEADIVEIGFVPDYYLLPPHLVTPKIIAEQNAGFEKMQIVTQKYRNGEIDSLEFAIQRNDIQESTKSAREIARENGLEIDFGAWSNTPFMTSYGGRFGTEVGINPKTGRPHDFDDIKPKKMGTTEGRNYTPSLKGLEEREKRIMAVYNTQKVAKKEQKQYEKAVDKWMGVKTDVTQVTKKGYNARNARVAQVLGDLNGFHRGSQTVTGSDFDALARSGRFYVVWRGAGKSEIASMSSRHPHIGGGEQGLGTYTTYLKGRASGYGKVTPMLIPKSAVQKGRMETGAWGSPYGDDTTYRHRQNLSHGESARMSTGDFKVANLSMVIVGPRNHPTNYILDGYGQWVDSALGDLRESDLE